MSPVVTPPMRKGKIPPFHDIGEMPFQEFCRDLLADMGNYKECRIFGIRGEKQYGIDIRCVLPTSGLEVAQCKCYEEYDAAQIKNASDDFLPHLEYWLSKGVRRFILIVACLVETTKAIDQIDIETKRFKEYGIDYELWDARQLRDLLRDHRKVVATHIYPADYWLKELCGDQFLSVYDTKTSYGINPATTILADNLNQLSALFTSKVSKELEVNRELFRQGKTTEVVNWINSQRSNEAEWLAIAPVTRGSILRLEAIVNIDCFENYTKAEQLLTEAKEIDPEGFDQRVRALLALHQKGPQAALNIINSAEDIDSICLQASLLLQLGRHKEAISLLVPIDSQKSAEVFRLLALAYLDDRDLDKATKSITLAKEINDQWESIQIADAVISYFSAFSPAAFRETHFVWPIPIGLELVKSTNEAIHALEHAADIFKKVAQIEPRRGTLSLSLRIWYAASLACDFRKQNEAEQEFSTLIKEHPTDHRLISWIISRGYKVNLQRSRQELKKLRKSGSVSSENVVSSVMIDIHEKTTRNTLHLIDSNKKVLIEEENEQLFDYWSFEILFARKMFHEAKKHIESSKYKRELEPLQLLLLQQEARTTKDFQPLVGYLVNSIETQQDALLLLELCHFYAIHQQWSLISPYSDKLITEIQTVEALKIVSAALYYLHQYKECKEFIETYKGLCFDNALPSDLVLIYIQCKAFSGEFPEALSDLRQLVESNPTKQNLLLLRDFYLLKGDKSGLRDIAYLVKKQADFKPDDLIQLASSLLWASPELAKQFLIMAPSDQLSTHQVIEKMVLGFSLGLDSEIKDIHGLFPNILTSKDAPIRMVTLEETIEIMKQKNQQRSELLSKYSTGEIPIHFLSKDTGSNLYALYKRALNNNSSVPANQKFPLYVRYGARPSLTDFKEPEQPLALNHFSLDITTLILLDHFSLLDIFEKRETPILLPVNTGQALVQMKQLLDQYQPDIVQASKLLLEYLNENRIRKIELISNQYSGDFDFDRLSNLVSSLGSLQGYVVGFSSELRTWNRLDVSKSNLKFVNLPDIIESLRTEAVITETKKSTTIDLLGTEGSIKTNTGVPLGSNLIFVTNTIRLLAQAGVLDEVCTNYVVWAESSEVSEIHASLSEERDRHAFATSLQNLIDRISKGIEDKKYVFLPYKNLEKEVEDLAEEDFLLRNLFDNFFAGQNSNIMPAIDDLFIQKQLHIQGANVLGIYELIWSAYKEGLIEEDRYYDHLIEFRKADLRYLPISGGEIYFHIRKTGIENNNVLENAYLRILKEYIASSLLTGRKLQEPNPPFDSLEKTGEFEYIISLVHSIAYALTKIWQNNSSEELKQIHSSWIFQNLYLDILTLCHVIGWERDSKDHIFLAAVGLAEFFLNGLQFPKDESNNSLRKDFNSWFYKNICEPRFNANSGLLEKTAEYIKKALASQILENENSEFEPYIRLFSESLYSDLPFPLRAVIDQDKEFLNQIGIEIITVIEVADIRFPAANFWNKLALVLEGHSVNIEAVDPKAEILFSSEDTRGISKANFIHPNNGKKITIESEDFVFVSKGNLQAWLVSNSDRFSELSGSELEAITAKIYLANSPAERMNLLDDLRKSSIGNFYQNLADELLSKQVLDFNHLLPPSKQSLCLFFNCSISSTKRSKIGDLVNQSSQELTTRFGLFAALTRITAFPVDIPTSLTTKIQDLPTYERDVLLSNLSSSIITPISRLHLIRLTAQFGNEEQTTKLIQSFFNEGSNSEISAFLLLLEWVTDAIERLSGEEVFSLEEKLLLAWGHTNELFKIFTQVSMPFNWLIDVLKEKKSQLPFKYVFTSTPVEWLDVVHAGRLDPLSFKILGLNYALGGKSKLPVEEQELLFQEAFPWKESTSFPATDLLEQREGNINVLDSFFGNEIDVALLNLTSGDDERISTISRASLNGLAAQAIEWLSSPDTAITGFQLLFPIYHTQEIPETLIKHFEENICKLNFGDLVTKNPTIAYIGFYFSACQGKRISEATRQFLIAQLMILTKTGSQLTYSGDDESGHSYRKEEVIAILFESAMQLAKGSQEDTVIDEFNYLLLEIVSRWKDSKALGLRLLTRIYQDVPVASAQKLGKALLNLRLIR